MKELIYQTILENLETIFVASGDNSDMAIAIKGTHVDYDLDQSDIEFEAKHLADEITKKLESK